MQERIELDVIDHSHDVVAVLTARGFTEVLDWDGTSDYQGWGVILATDGTRFAVIGWDYGTCPDCDRYLDENDEEARRKMFDDIVEIFDDRAAADAEFAALKKW